MNPGSVLSETHSGEKASQRQGKENVSTPEDKAYVRILQISDPAKKLAALHRFLSEYPRGKQYVGARYELIGLLIKYYPKPKQRITIEADKYIQAIRHQAEKEGRPAGPSVALARGFVASRLLESGIYLTDAEALATEATRELRKDEYIDGFKKQVIENAGRVLTDERLERSYDAEHGWLVGTLGGIYLKLGKLAEAEPCLETSLKYSDDKLPPLLGLADIAEKRGDESGELQYLSGAMMQGVPSVKLRERFEALFRKSHNGSIDGMDDFLDQKFIDTRPVKVDPYRPTNARSDRIVLAELFTGSACPPCVGMDAAFDGILERYPAHEVAVVVYHQHVPHPDPMANSATIQRAKFYGVQGVPYWAVDGTTGIGGGARTSGLAIYNDLNAKIEKDLLTPSDARLNLNLGLDAEHGDLKVTATVSVPKESQDPRLQIILVENLIKYVGDNGVRFQPMVVREIANYEQGGFTLTPGKDSRVQYVFNLSQAQKELKAYLDGYEANSKTEAAAGRGEAVTFPERMKSINVNDLSIVAFIQDGKSKRILQAAYLKVPPEDAANQPR